MELYTDTLLEVAVKKEQGKNQRAAEKELAKQKRFEVKIRTLREVFGKRGNDE
jgi:DNA-binding protein H-NS